MSAIPGFFAATPMTSLLLVALAVFLGAVSMGFVAVSRAHSAQREYQIKLGMLPAIDKLRAADASLDERRRDMGALEGRLSELRREQAEAERHQLDAEHWQGLAEQAERDYRNKEEIIKAVDDLRDKHEEAAKDVAARNEEIKRLIQERDEIAATVIELKAKLDNLGERQQEIDAIERRIEEKTEELAAIRSEVSELRDQREEMLQARFDVDQLNRRKADLEEALERLPEQIQELTAQRDELTRYVSELEKARDRLREIKDEVDRLVERKNGLNTDVEALNREKNRLEDEVGGVRPAGAEGAEGEFDKALEDIKRPPACLFDNHGPLLKNPIDETDETQMLQKVRDHLEDQNLKFTDRTIKRFHTCLKTSRITPITVLAGISGTGKSQLPQRYAEGMGMHFLKIAVQPRWDGPQDLLGFYNYLEKSYKATDIARALLCMDKHSSSDQGGSMSDRVLLILLDEMNLARVEYYFSEFLSRLEGRPSPEATDPALLRAAEIEIDIPSKEDRDPLTVYPGHNVLFSGTMNEDESTQSLSDKVLDRANIIRFPRPEQLESETQEDVSHYSVEHLPLKTWLSWHKTTDSLDGEKQQIIIDFVEKLNDALDSFRRPFGHRVNQAIFSYVANHPDASMDEGVRMAIADMLEMRILPKLRGVQLEGTAREGLEKIRDIVDSDLQQTDLAEAIGRDIDRALSEGELFTWSGL